MAWTSYIYILYPIQESETSHRAPYIFLVTTVDTTTMDDTTTDLTTTMVETTSLGTTLITI
jgi:hypothetical protein